MKMDYILIVRNLETGRVLGTFTRATTVERLHLNWDNWELIVR